MLFAALIAVLGIAYMGNILNYVTIIVIVLLTILLYKIRLQALIISSIMTGVGGAFMSMSYVSMFTEDMVAGRGFIALAAEAMGNGHPVLSSVSVLLFGVADALSNNLQILNIPSEILRIIPYLFTTLILGLYAYRKKHQKNK